MAKKGAGRGVTAVLLTAVLTVALGLLCFGVVTVLAGPRVRQTGVTLRQTPELPQTGQPRASHCPCACCSRARSPLIVSAPRYCSQSVAWVVLPVSEGAENSRAFPRQRT